MDSLAGDLERALDAVRSASLPHPDGPLLERFLEDAADPEQAARYMLRRCVIGRVEADFKALLLDWKQLLAALAFNRAGGQRIDKAVVADISTRDQSRCSITGLGPSFWDPLVVAPLFQPAEFRIDSSLHQLLGAFVGPELLNWLLVDAPSLNTYQTHWLVRESAAKAMSQGFFQVTLCKKPEYRVNAVLIGGPDLPPILDKIPLLRRGFFAEQSDSGIDPPDNHALQFISRFAKPIRWSLVARQIASRGTRAVTESPASSAWRLLSDQVAAVLTAAWRLLPSYGRIQAYRGLAFLGARMYGSSCSLKVQRLPFGMYLKTSSVKWQEGLANEYGALELVRRHTSVSVARPLDLVSNSRDSYLLTSRIPGQRLGACIDTLSDEEARTLVCDLQRSFGELRAIPKSLAPELAITNALGKACYDARITMSQDYDEERGDFIGPFATEDDFNECLRAPALPSVSHRAGHDIVFAHGDLNMRNVLVRNGRFSGIVDWEYAGWYPEYWDYTKAHYITKLHQRWLGMVDDVFKVFGGFEAELETERQLWHYCL